MKSFAAPHIPAEWEPHAAIWAGWPTLREEWGAAFDGARAEITEFVKALSKHVPVHLAAGSAEAAASAQAAAGSFAQIHQIALGDIWLRDTGPIISTHAGHLSAQCFRFDGWGGKFVMPGDTETSAAISDALDLPITQHGFVLEGGAIDVDGAGNLLTTRQCLLDGVRNPGWDEAAAENALKRSFGVSNIIWLECGLVNDHTDGHVDNIARFVAPGRAVCQRPSGAEDPQADVLHEIEEQLRASGLTVETIPSPGRVSLGGDIAPASHLNFVITNNAIIMPVFEKVLAKQAEQELSRLFPSRRIVPLPARNILSGGGTFHCMTREIPALPIAEKHS